MCHHHQLCENLKDAIPDVGITIIAMRCHEVIRAKHSIFQAVSPKVKLLPLLASWQFLSSDRFLPVILALCGLLFQRAQAGGKALLGGLKTFCLSDPTAFGSGWQKPAHHTFLNDHADVGWLLFDKPTAPSFSATPMSQPPPQPLGCVAPSQFGSLKSPPFVMDMASPGQLRCPQLVMDAWNLTSKSILCEI
jgi:hypothetical protein